MKCLLRYSEYVPLAFNDSQTVLCVAVLNCRPRIKENLKLNSLSVKKKTRNGDQLLWNKHSSIHHEVTCSFFRPSRLNARSPRLFIALFSSYSFRSLNMLNADEQTQRNWAPAPNRRHDGVFYRHGLHEKPYYYWFLLSELSLLNFIVVR